MKRDFLPEIAFCETDTAKVEAAVITKYEELAGAALYPGDPVRLFLESVASLLAQQNSLIDFTGKQNMLHYASGGYLDHLGYYLSTQRLPEQSSTADFEFTLVNPRPAHVVVPQGTRIRASSDIVFATTAELLIAPGKTAGRVPARCLTNGSIGNGYHPGQIRQLVDPVAYIASVQNIVTSHGGVDSESDDNLRGRIALAAEQYASCGSLDAYRYHVRSVHQGISDVAIWQPEPGHVHVAPLMAGGKVPTDAVIKSIHDHLASDAVRPFTDTVTVRKPSVIKCDASIIFFVLTSYAARSVTIIKEVEAQANAWLAWQRTVLGRDVLPSKLIELVQSVDGVQRVQVLSPAYRALNPWEVAIITIDSITYGGLAGD